MSAACSEGRVVDLGEYRRRRAQTKNGRVEGAPVYTTPPYAWIPVPVIIVLVPVWAIV